MTKTEIVTIIRKVLSRTEDVVAQLRAEKKRTGDYSKSVMVKDGDLEMQFYAQKFLGKYPPISVKLLFFVTVFRNGTPLMKCRVGNIKVKFEFNFNLSNGHYSCSEKYKMCSLLCDTSHVRPLFKTGDTLCIDNKGKAAFAKVEILSEDVEEVLSKVNCLRKVRLTKELGHKEKLAYLKWKEMVTYVADDSTQEFFGDKDTKEMVLPIYLKIEERSQDDYFWNVYTEESLAFNSKLELTTPTTEAEALQQLKQKALDTLLDNCRGEFCYGDPRVETYKEDYMILGEEVIDSIHEKYLTWLNENCTTFPQEANSGEFTGIAIDWHGKEDQQPKFDDVVLSDL